MKGERDKHSLVYLSLTKCRIAFTGSFPHRSSTERSLPDWFEALGLLAHGREVGLAVPNAGREPFGEEDIAKLSDISLLATLKISSTIKEVDFAHPSSQEAKITTSTSTPPNSRHLSTSATRDYPQGVKRSNADKKGGQMTCTNIYQMRRLLLLR